MTPVSFDLSGKVALLTGAARGIGLAMAQALAANGAAVAIQDIAADIAESEAAAIRQAGGKAIGLGGDLTDIAVAPGLIEQTVAKLGGLHILINNAGIQKAGQWIDITAEEAMRQWTVNMLVPLTLCQLACPIFKQQKFGRIVNVSSIQARRGNTHMLSYSMSKAAMNNLTSALGHERELVSQGITVNGLMPGWFYTLRNQHDFKNEQDKIEKGKHVPIGRIGEPRDCAGVTLMLCSQAGEYISGETIVVSGGM